MRNRWLRHLVVAMVALLGLLALPIGVAADTCACDPIQPFLVVDRFDETHVTYRNADRPGIVYASNKSGSWVRTRITSSRDEAFAIAVDSAQKVYIVFQREVDDAVGFRLVSNRTGAWAVTGLSIIHPDAYDVHIQVDPAKKIHLAWTTDEHAWYATNETGTWVRRQLDHAMGANTKIALDTAGNVHLLYLQCTNDGVGTCEGAGIYYETDKTGSWVAQRISTDQEDKPQDLLIDPAGKVHLVFAREYNSQAQPNLPLGVYYVTNATGTWKTLRAAAPGRMASIARTPGGAIHISFARVDGNLGIFLATRRNGVWTVTEAIKEYALYPTIGIESDGRLHLSFMRMAIDPGIYHAIFINGGWARRELMD